MLEIGSIVYLKKGSRKVMILNRGPILIKYYSMDFMTKMRVVTKNFTGNGLKEAMLNAEIYRTMRKV